MSKNNLQSVFILILAGMLSVPCFLAEAIAQDRIPVCPPLGKTAKLIKPLREMNWANDTITVQISFPSAFRETVANMNDADCIFGESGTHLTEMFKDGSQQSDAVNNFVPASFAES